MRRVLIAAVFIAAAFASASGQAASQPNASQSGSAEQAVVKVTNDWLEAEGKCDREAIARIVGDDFVGTAPTGRTVRKPDVLPRCNTSGESHLRMSAHDISARTFGDTAVVTGRGVGTGQEAQHEMRFTLVYVKRQAGWQMVAAHLSPVPRADP